MSRLSRMKAAVVAAINRIECANAVHPSTRATALAQLRNRISDAIVRLAAQAEQQHHDVTKEDQP